MADAFVVGLVHKAAQRREASAHEQFEIADLPSRKVPGRPLARVRLQFAGFFRRDQQIYQFAAMRRIQMTRRSGQLREPPKFFSSLLLSSLLLDLQHLDSASR